MLENEVKRIGMEAGCELFIGEVLKNTRIVLLEGFHITFQEATPIDSLGFKV